MLKTAKNGNEYAYFITTCESRICNFRYSYYVKFAKRERFKIVYIFVHVISGIYIINVYAYKVWLVVVHNVQLYVFCHVAYHD